MSSRLLVPYPTHLRAISTYVGRHKGSSSSIEPCIPMFVDKPPSGPKWRHEIKWDGDRVSIKMSGSFLEAGQSRALHELGRILLPPKRQ